MKFILGTKKGMKQLYDENTGRATVVTIIEAGPCYVTQIKMKEHDGTSAVQIAFGARKKHISKPIAGHLKDIPKGRFLREFPVSDDVEAGRFHVGDKLTTASFVPGDVLKVTGTSKGRGFQGVVKRHGFSGSPKSHGHKDQLRMPGSIGATAPQHVFKGMRMAGHMGANRVTVSNLTVIEVHTEENKLFVKGAVPGSMQGLLLIKAAGDMVVEKKVEDVVSAVHPDSRNKEATHEGASTKDSAEEVSHVSAA